MHALILIDHGSRRPAANALLEELAPLVRARAGVPVYVAHMELAEPSLDAAVDRAAVAGARDIVVVPYFLGPGRHATEDIPALARAAEDRRPDITLRVAEPLGIHPLLAELVLVRAREAEGGRAAPAGPTGAHCTK
ncbi:MAG: sirohydrochlorin chelatase [Sandaracinaceae bacterium]